MTLKLVEPLKTFKSEVKEDMIERLEEMLQWVKDDKIEGVAIAASLPDGSSYTNWSMANSFQMLIASVTILQWRMLNARPQEDKPGVKPSA